jgi:RNAse (barnase) inhibitor barstar
MGLKENPREKLKDNFMDALWDNIRTKVSVPIDSAKKRGQRTINEL